MRSWLQRLRADASSAGAGAGAGGHDPDSPQALAHALDELEARINRNGGRLPTAATVAALDVTDLVGQLLETTLDDAVPDVEVVLAVRGLVRDYLPTTLDRFLALDPSVLTRPLQHGRSPVEQVVDQLAAMADAAADVLAATRARDTDALVSQGIFLRTKFSRSDLDL
ncbi:hypothetical protein [Nocardioides sp.]|uniref:hypothetical protein n=1 Tax=Nocardioides sp. TaxID=35761 RepID=UPI0035189B34